jgi:hypothetical protein
MEQSAFAEQEEVKKDVVMSQENGDYKFMQTLSVHTAAVRSLAC